MSDRKELPLDKQLKSMDRIVRATTKLGDAELDWLYYRIAADRQKRREAR